MLLLATSSLELLCNRAELIRLADRCCRIAHQAMWIEWADSNVAPGRGNTRVGVLVLVLADDESGRRGTMHSFSQDEARKP